jgi:hypothetical protein
MKSNRIIVSEKARTLIGSNSAQFIVDDGVVSCYNIRVDSSDWIVKATMVDFAFFAYWGVYENSKFDLNANTKFNGSF